jgi:YD repeat-containing protein
LYDAAWNVQAGTNAGALSGYDVDSKNELTNANGNIRAFDANGNVVTNNNDLVYWYDAENRVTQISDTVYRNFQTAFTYDGLGRLRNRLEQTWNGSKWITASTTQYIYDGTRVVQERDGSNNPLVSYSRGTDLSGSLEWAGGIGGVHLENISSSSRQF